MKKAVFIGTHFPDATATAAGWRIIQIIEILQNNNFEVHFIATSTLSNINLPAGIHPHLTKINCNSFDSLIIDIGPDLVFFDRFMSEEQFGWRVSACLPNAVKILDSIDLHFLRKEREDLYLKNQVSEKSKTIFFREIGSMMRCDLTIIISLFEHKLLIEKYNFSPNQLFYLPFISKSLTPPIKSFAERKHFVFVGNFLHEPNWQTVLVLKQIWPKIKRLLQDSELHIYGAYMPEKAKALDDKKQGFLMKGHAENINTTFENYRVLLAPIPFGAGLKGKLFESFCYGLPNITTPMGAEGLCFEDLWNGFIANNQEAIIELAIKLYQNETVWNDKQKNGFQIIAKHFNWNTFEKPFITFLNHLTVDLRKHRASNFMFGVFNYHMMQSTKFMSKWIEEKNKFGKDLQAPHE